MTFNLYTKLVLSLIVLYPKKKAQYQRFTSVMQNIRQKLSFLLLKILGK